MFKLKKYLKPFIFPLICAIMLLFLQAVCDLNLPNYMSDIVNVGIQANGIENAAPEAISENGMKLIECFATDEEKMMLQESYELILAGNTEYSKDYPEVANCNIYVLKDKKNIEWLNKIFQIADRTFINVMTAMSANSGNEGTSITDNTQIDFEKVYEMLPMLQNLPEEQLSKERESAEKTDETMLSQVAVAFTKLFYEELGMNISKIQTNYIITAGAKMLGMTLIVAIAAAVCST